MLIACAYKEKTMTAYNIKVLKSEGKFTVVPDESELYNLLVSASTENAAKKIALKDAKIIAGLLQEKVQQQKWIEEGAVKVRLQKQLKKINKKPKSK